MPVQIGGNSVATEEELDDLESDLDRVLDRLKVLEARIGTHSLAGDVESLKGEMEALKALTDKLQKSVDDLGTSLGTVADTIERNYGVLTRVNEELASGNTWLQQATTRLGEQAQAEIKYQAERSEAVARQMAQNKSYHVAILLALDEYRSNLASLMQLEQDSARNIEHALQGVSEVILETRDLVREEISAMTGMLRERAGQQERQAQQASAAFGRLAGVQEQICGHAENMAGAAASLAQRCVAVEDYQRDQLALIRKRRAQEFNNDAVVLLQRGEYVTAVNLLEEALSLEKCDPAIYVNLGRAYACLGQTAKASQTLQAALAFAAEAPAVHNGLALLCLEQGQPADALPHLLNSIKQEPNDPNTWLNLGKVHYQLDQVSRAIADWQQAQRLDPTLVANDAEVRLLLDNSELLAAQK